MVPSQDCASLMISRMPAAPSQFPSSCSSAPAPHNPKSSAPYFLHPRRLPQQSPTHRHETAIATPAPQTSTAFERLAATRAPANAARRTTRASEHASGSSTAHAAMDTRRRPEYNLEIFADAACVKDVVKGKSLVSLKNTSVLRFGATFSPHHTSPRPDSAVEHS
jgi:hypothetical protein